MVLCAMTDLFRRSIVLTDIVDISVWEDHVVAEVDRSIVVLMHQRQVIVEHVHKR